MEDKKTNVNMHSYLVVYNKPFENIISQIFHAESAMEIITKLQADRAKYYDNSVIYNIVKIDDL